MKLKNKLNETIKEDKYKRFILSMMGETGGGKVFTAGISYDRWFSEASVEEKAFSSFISAREWCERAFKKYNSEYKECMGFIVMSNIDNVQEEVCLCFNGNEWNFWDWH